MTIRSLLAAATIGTVIALTAPADAATQTDSVSREILGAWSGTMIHEGASETFAMELESSEDDTLLVRVTAPAMHLSRAPVGRVRPVIEDDRVTLGPFLFRYDREQQTLGGLMPKAMVPHYDVPLSLRKVDSIPPLERARPTTATVAPLWSFDSGAPVWAGTRYAKRLVYAGNDAGRVFALRAEDGSEVWSFEAGGPIRTRPTVIDDAVFLQADDGYLYRLDALSGKQQWRVRLLEAAVQRLPPSDPNARYDFFAADVVPAHGRLYVGTHDGRLLAIDPEQGRQLWAFQAEGSILAAPTVADGRVLFGAFGGRVHALDAETGSELWTADTQGAVVSSPAVSDRRVIVGNRNYDLFGLDADTGVVVWKKYIWFSWVESTAQLRDGVAYIGSSDAAAVFAVDAETGTEHWRSDVHGWCWGQPEVTDERLFVQTAAMRGYQGDNHHGAVVALDRDSGATLWRYAVEAPDQGPWGFPGSLAVGARKVFAAGLDGRVLAFRAEESVGGNQPLEQ